MRVRSIRVSSASLPSCSFLWYTQKQVRATAVDCMNFPPPGRWTAASLPVTISWVMKGAFRS